jgi:hypothetical protein
MGELGKDWLRGGGSRPHGTHGASDFATCCCVYTASVCGRVQVPLQRPGFYPVSLTNFVACVPPSACNGIDAAAVAVVYGRLRTGNDSGEVASEELLGIMAGHLQVVSVRGQSHRAGPRWCGPPPLWDSDSGSRQWLRL